MVTRREIIGARSYHRGPLTLSLVGACRLAKWALQNKFAVSTSLGDRRMSGMASASSQSISGFTAPIRSTRDRQNLVPDSNS